MPPRTPFRPTDLEEPVRESPQPAVAQAEKLRALSPAQLAERFAAGECPDGVDVLDGDPVGLGLSLARPLPRPLEARARRHAAAPRFAWHGKSFRSSGPDAGIGWNRLAVGPVLAALPFETAIVASRLDGRPAIGVSYDAPRVPYPARPMYDELREVAPGVFAGPAGVLLGARYRILFWFAVDTTRQVHEIRFAGVAPGQ